MTRVRRLSAFLEKEEPRPRAQSRARDRRGRPLRARRHRSQPRPSLRRLAVFIVVVALTGGAWSLRIGRIGASGLQVREPGSLRQVLAPALGQRWLTVDTRALVDSLEADPWIEHARIHRRLPPALEVELEEARPCFRLSEESGTWAVDADGCLLPLVGDLDLRALPVLEGVAVDAAGGLRASDRRRLQHVTAALAQGAWPFTGGLERVRLLADEQWALTTVEGVELRFPERGAAARLRALAAAWPRLHPRPGDFVDLRFARQVVLRRASSSLARTGARG